MKGRPIPYSAEELAWIEERREWPRAVLHEVFVLLFERSDVTPGALAALCKRKGWFTGRTGRFERGQAPANKGKTCPEGVGGRHPNARKTQFVKGERRGVAVKLYQPIGTERLSKEGYRERKIHDGMPLQSRWRAVHLIEWEAINGPLPKGYCLKCLGDDKTNADPSNWEAIPRALLPRLNGGRHKTKLAYGEAAPEVRPSILAIAKVEHAARQARRKRREAAA